jgi:hypothetical protein
MPNTNPKYQCQQVAYNKKPRRNTEEFDSAKKEDYWLGDPVIVNNRYSTLSDEEAMEDEPYNVEPKPPSIFISRVKNIKPLAELLNAIAPDKYILKTFYSSQVKVQPLEILTYTTITKALIEEQTEFHTYEPRNERGYRVVLRNIHPTTESEDIKESLRKKGHEVTNVWNIKQRDTKTPLPIPKYNLELLTSNVKFPNSSVIKDLYTRKNLSKPPQMCQICSRTPNRRMSKENQRFQRQMCKLW